MEIFQFTLADFLTKYVLFSKKENTKKHKILQLGTQKRGSTIIHRCFPVILQNACKNVFSSFPANYSNLQKLLCVTKLLQTVHHIF